VRPCLNKERKEWERKGGESRRGEGKKKNLAIAGEFAPWKVVNINQGYCFFQRTSL
jgi:hypothetical protein